MARLILAIPSFARKASGPNTVQANARQYLLSRGMAPHYHRRETFSLLSSRWIQVVPACYCRRANRSTQPHRKRPEPKHSAVKGLNRYRNICLPCLSHTAPRTIRALYGQASRAISTGQLNASLHFHIPPINVVVFNGPSGIFKIQGDLILREASRLDAFSGYPVHT